LAGVLRVVNRKWEKIVIKRKKFGFEALAAVAMESTSFWDVTPYSLVEIYQDFGAHHTASTFNVEEYSEQVSKQGKMSTPRWLLAWMYSSILKLEAVRFSETSVTYRITPHHIPGVRYPYCKNKVFTGLIASMVRIRVVVSCTCTCFLKDSNV
jgi:hypothetical protein